MADESLLGGVEDGAAEGGQAEGATGPEGKAAGAAEAEGADGAKGAKGAEGEGGKADDDADGEGDGASDADNPNGAPEAYEDFTVPENLTADEAQLTEFTEFAKELNLSQVGAQKVMEKFGEQIGKFQEAQQKAWADIQAEWKKEVETDKDIGGPKLQETLVSAKAGLKAFGNPEFVEIVEKYGLGNNKAVIRFLADVGKAASEGGFHFGGKTQNEPKSLASRIYTQPDQQ